MTGWYSGYGTGSNAYRLDYQLDMFDRIEDKTMVSEKILGSDPPYMVDSGEDGYGELPTAKELGEWVADIYQYRETDFLAEYKFHDFQYTLPAIYTLVENESDTDTQKYKTDSSAIFVNYYSKQKFTFESTAELAETCMDALQSGNAQQEELGLVTYEYGDITEKNGLCYFTYTKDKWTSGTQFGVVAFYETQKGFYAVEFIGSQTDAEKEFLALASAMNK